MAAGGRTKLWGSDVKIWSSDMKSQSRNELEATNQSSWGQPIDHVGDSQSCWR